MAKKRPQTKAARPQLTDGEIPVVGAREPAWFDDERGQLIVAIADQCGLAVERALLYEAELEARRSADRRLATLSLLNQAAGRLAGAPGRRQEQGRQQADDGDHDQQFDECQPGPAESARPLV